MEASLCENGWLAGWMINKWMDDSEINGGVDELLDGHTDGSADGLII